jgi:hypothetical protein
MVVAVTVGECVGASERAGTSVHAATAIATPAKAKVSGLRLMASSRVRIDGDTAFDSVARKCERDSFAANAA